MFHRSVSGARIRLASPADAAGILAIYQPFITDSVVSFEIEPIDEVEMSRRISHYVQTHPWLVYERAGEILGYVYASKHNERAAYRWSADVSVYTGPAQRRMGLGRALYTSLFACLRLQGIYNAYAGITLPNPASVGLHESMGFTPVGVYRSVGYKFAGWHDVGWWEMELTLRPPSPAEPVSLRQAVRMSEWKTAIDAGLPLIRF